jgi:hypothetical protein
MGNIMLTKVSVNGTDVTAKLINYKFEKTFGQEIAIITLKFSKFITSLVTLANGQTLTVSRGWTTSTDESIFSGFIESYEPEGGTITIIGKDKLSQLVNREVTYSYDAAIDPSAGKLSAIFSDLVTTYGGLTADGTSVQDSGTTVTLSKYVCNHTGVFERCKKLADLQDWQFYYKASTDKVYYEPKGFSNNTTTLQTGTNIINIPKWTFDTTEMINKVTVIGAQTCVQTTEKFNGNGSTKIFAITKKPVDITVYLSATDPPPESAKQTMQVEGSTNSANVYVDFEKKQVRFASAPGVGTNNVQVIYTYAIPTPVVADDSSSIAAYGLYQKTVFETDIKNITDGESRARSFVTKYGQPFVSTTLQIRNVSTASLDVGQKVYVNDTVNNIARYVVINKYTIEYPNRYDTLEVGDRQWRLSNWGTKIMENLQRLNEEASNNQDYLLHVVSHTVQATAHRYSLDIWRQFIGSSFIIGHTTNGVINSGAVPHVIGDYRTGSTVLYSARY